MRTPGFDGFCAHGRQMNVRCEDCEQRQYDVDGLVPAGLTIETLASLGPYSPEARAELEEAASDPEQVAGLCEALLAGGAAEPGDVRYPTADEREAARQVAQIVAECPDAEQIHKLRESYEAMAITGAGARAQPTACLTPVQREAAWQKWHSTGRPSAMLVEVTTGKGWTMETIREAFMAGLDARS